MTREEAIEVIKAYRDKLTNSASNQLDGDIKAFEMAIQALSQEPCDDAISKQNIIDTYKSCADMLSDEELKGADLVMEWVNNAPTVTQKPIECDDAISREAVIKDFTPLHNGEITLESAIDYLHKTGWMQEHDRILSERQTGEWIEHEIKDTCRWLTCSNCGYEWINKKENFCPNCGVKMESEE